MLEEELYEPMRMWLEQYIVSNKKVDYIIPMEKSLGADTATNLLLKVLKTMRKERYLAK